MAIIDPDGLFHGDRLRRCSDLARLWWPYLFLAANGFGRFEVNYQRMLGEVFAGFRSPPDEHTCFSLLAEYHGNHLLFLYEAVGATWAQWYCKPGCLPRWKTKRDRDSPEPPEPSFSNWINSYVSESARLPKISEILGSLPKNGAQTAPSGPLLGPEQNHSPSQVSDSRSLPKTSEKTPKFPHGIGEGVGVGVGVGDGNNSVATHPCSGVVATRQNAGVCGDAFAEFIGMFLAAGKPINERDKEKALRRWLNYDESECQLILCDLLPRFSDGTWSDVRHTPMPVNYLEAESWRRRAPARSLPKPLGKSESATARAAEMFLAERKP